MEPHTRMMHVLGWLAVSMIVGSITLSWLEPTPAIPQSSVSPDKLATAARSAVDACNQPLINWNGIEILPVPVSRGLALTAIERPNGLHFSITDNGQIIADNNWRDQAAYNTETKIRIGLTATESSQQPEEAQSMALAALLDTLNITVSGAPQPQCLPVRLSGWAAESGFAGNIQRMISH